MQTQQALEVAKTLARMAAERILLYYGDTIDNETKTGGSPVTIADKEADAMILRGLRQAYPNHSYLTEESEDDLSRLDAQHVWIVDPLDGTKEFLKNNGEFTVNIALVKDGEPILGAIAIPAKNMLYWGAKGHGAFQRKGREEIQEIQVSDETDPSEMTLVRSASHIDPKTNPSWKRHVSEGHACRQQC
jgi:3''-Phosphoadenosine 5''-phosphosulfate (PAPS) 3''-phosphatase